MMSVFLFWLPPIVALILNIFNLCYQFYLSSKGRDEMTMVPYFIPLIIYTIWILNLNTGTIYKVLLFLAALLMEALCDTFIPIWNEGHYNGKSNLHRAILKGNLDKVMEALNDGCDPNQADHRGLLPLYQAVFEHRKDIVEVLLKHHADMKISYLDHYRPSPLVLSALIGDYPIFALFFEQLSPEYLEKEKMSLFMDAIEGGNHEIFDLLVQENISLSDSAPNNYTLLHRAATYNNKYAAEYLLSKGMDPNARYYPKTPFVVPTESEGHAYRKSINYDRNLEELIQEGITPLREALLHGSHETAKLLLEHGGHE